MPVPRAEYLARSLSRRQPWVAEGISRRQWERRRKMPSATSAPAASPPAITSTPAKRTHTPLSRDLTANVGGPASKAPRTAADPADDIVPARKRPLWRNAECSLIRRIHAYLDTQGMTLSDPQSLAQAIHAITVPEPFKHMDGRALGKVYRRTRGRLPVGYDRWIGLVEKWDKSYNRQKARDLVDRLVTVLDGNRPLGILDRMFERLEKRVCDHLPNLVRRLESECERLKNDKCYIPKFRPPRTDATKERVYAELADGPKTKKELARTVGKPYGAISSVGLRLRNEGLITTIWRGGQSMWARASTVPPFIPARDGIVTALQKGPMTVPALAQDTGKGTSTVKCALHRHLLANGTVIRTGFGLYALPGTQPPYVSRGQAIIAALKKGPMSFQALAREINSPPSSLPQFLEPLLAKGIVIRVKRGIYALHGSAPVYVLTRNLIISALAKKPMKRGALVQHVNKSTKVSRSRATIGSVLTGLIKEGTVKQDRWGGEYRLARRVRAVARRSSRIGAGHRIERRADSRIHRG
jgi:DNA-binding transcriptional ArsR family regulator